MLFYTISFYAFFVCGMVVASYVLPKIPQIYEWHDAKKGAAIGLATLFVQQALFQSSMLSVILLGVGFYQWHTTKEKYANTPAPATRPSMVVMTVAAFVTYSLMHLVMSMLSMQMVLFSFGR